MAMTPQNYETVEIIRPRLEIGPATKLFLLLDGIGCLVTMLAPDWTGSLLAQYNPELFGAMHVWTPFTGTVVIDSIGALLYIASIVFFILRQVEICLRPKWFWVYWASTTLAGALAGWILIPRGVFAVSMVPPLAACGAAWWLCRSERWNFFGLEVKARIGIAIAALLGFLAPLIMRQFAVVAAWGIALAAGYGCIRLLEWRDSGFSRPQPRNRQKQEKSHYIELD